MCGGAGEDDPPPEAVPSLLEATSFWEFALTVMRAQSLCLPSVLEDASGPGYVWLAVLPGAKAPRMTSQCGGIELTSCQTYRSVRYRVDVVPILPQSPVPVSMFYGYRYRLRYIRSYRYRRCRYWCRTELTEVSGTGVYVVPNLTKCPVPVLIPYRSYRRFRYRYWQRTELTGVSGTGVDVVPNLPRCLVPARKSVPAPPVLVLMS